MTLVQHFAAYSQWRTQLAENLEAFRACLADQDLTDAQTDLRLTRLLDKLQEDRLHVAFVAELPKTPAGKVHRKLLRERPTFLPGEALQVARYNKFQACRYGFDAQISCPERRRQDGLRESLANLLDILGDEARELGCQRWLDVLRRSLFSGTSDADWLRARLAVHKNLHDVVRDSLDRFRELRHPSS